MVDSHLSQQSAILLGLARRPEPQEKEQGEEEAEEQSRESRHFAVGTDRAVGI
jgi:hypothetical protein